MSRLTKKTLHCWYNMWPGGFVYFHRNSKMAPSSHGLTRITTEQILEEIFANGDYKLVTTKVKIVGNVITKALILKKAI